MRPRLLNPAFLSASLASLLACSAERTAAPSEHPSFARGGVPAEPGPATFAYHAGDAFLASLNPAFAPAKAMAANGEVIELSATGTLSVFPKAVTGGGTFTHKDANGNVIGSGTWTATELLSFQNYGASPVPGFPLHSARATRSSGYTSRRGAARCSWMARSESFVTCRRRTCREAFRRASVSRSMASSTSTLKRAATRSSPSRRSAASQRRPPRG